MPNIIELAGQSFERMTVVKRVTSSNGHHAMWECLCSCGRTKVCRGSHLTRGKIRSCGCLHTEMMAKVKAEAAADLASGKTIPAKYFSIDHAFLQKHVLDTPRRRLGRERACGTCLIGTEYVLGTSRGVLSCDRCGQHVPVTFIVEAEAASLAGIRRGL